MEHSLYKFILKYSLKQQIVLVVLSLTSFVPYYYYLSMPKTIVNRGIDGKNVTFPVDMWALGVIQLDQLNYLLVLCFGFLGLVIVQQCFKYAINVFQGISGERMLRRLRYELYARILRFPLPVFRKMSAGEIIPMITAEVEPLGGFIADSFALPIFQGGMLLVTFIFLLVQNPVMAVAAVALYPMQFWLIPKMQRKVNQLGKERVKTARQLADRIHESISGVQEIHAHDASNRFRAEFTRRLGRIYWIRYEIFQRKFMIKFLNNFLQQLGPFFFYSIGGYLVIQGQLDLGQIVAAVNAHKEMAAPWKELLNYYQTREDSRIKYEQVITQFAPDGMRDITYQIEEPTTPVDLTGEIQVSNLTINSDTGETLVDGVTLAIPMPSRVAVVGGSGREELMLAMARLIDPARGRISIGGNDINNLPEAVTGRRMAYLGQTGYVFNSTIGENLFFSVRHRALSPRERSADQQRAFDREMLEAEASGNSLDDPDADYTDYAAAGAADQRELRAVGASALKLALLDEDVYQLGLRGTIDPSLQPEAADAILKARLALREKLHDGDLDELIESWDRSRYNRNATVAENLMFGAPIGERFNPERMADNEYVWSVLEKAELKARFVAIGYDVAKTMVELFADLPPDHEFFQEFSFISSDDLPAFQEILGQTSADKLGELDLEKQRMLVSLPFKLIVARHRLGHIDDEIQSRVLAARQIFASDLPPKLRSAVAFFDPDRYTLGGSIQDNILFGKIAFGQPKAAEKVGAVIGEVIDTLDLRETVTAVGMMFETGIGGSRLNAAQRQKLVIARALVKRPDLLIANETLSSFDGATQAQLLDNLLAWSQGRGLVFAIHNAALAKSFDRVVVVDNGKVIEQGAPAELDQDGRAFHRLVHGQ